MSRPVVLTVAITGSGRRKADNPAVPLAPNEQIESTHEAWEAVAALVRLHVRNPDGSPSSDPDRFGQVMEGVRKHCPGIIVQFSAGDARRGTPDSLPAICRIIRLHSGRPALRGAGRAVADIHEVAGRNLGSVTVSLTSSKTTSTAIPTLIIAGSGSIPTRFVGIRAPPSTSTTATT